MEAPGEGSGTRWGNSASMRIDTPPTPSNTMKSRKGTWRQFKIFCKERNYKLNEPQTEFDLADMMSDWATNMRKLNGEEYKDHTVKTMWNVSAKLLQEHYFEQFGITIDPFRDLVFKAARDARDAKRKELSQLPNKVKVPLVKFTKDEKELLASQWKEETPEGLQRKFFHAASCQLDWRGNEASRARINYFCEETDIDELGNVTERIEYNSKLEIQYQGQLPDSKWLFPNKENPDLCPVRLYRLLLSHRPKHVTSDRLFLTPNPSWDKDHSVGWYKDSPVGKNQLGKWTKDSANKAGLEIVESTNVCNCNAAPLVTHLAKAIMLEPNIANFRPIAPKIVDEEAVAVPNAVEKNVAQPLDSTLKVTDFTKYIHLGAAHHQNILNEMRKNGNGSDGVDSAMDIQQSSDGLHISYNNCTFYIYTNGTS